MSWTIARSPYFSNAGYRLDRTLASGRFVGRLPASLELVLKEGNLDSVPDTSLVDVLEGVLRHFDFVMADQGPNTDRSAYILAFARGLRKAELTLPTDKARGRFSLISDVPLHGFGSLNGGRYTINEADIVGMIGKPFPDDSYFASVAGICVKEHPDQCSSISEADDIVETFRFRQPGSLAAPSSNGTERIFIGGRIKDVDVSGFLPIVNRKTARRLAGTASLAGTGKLYPFPYGRFSRFTHEVAAFDVMRVLCDRFGIEGSQRTKNLAHALCHDDGHLLFGHPAEDYFKYVHRSNLVRFDHEESSTWQILEERREFDNVMPGLADMIVALFNEEDRDHVLVTADLGGVDRIQYLATDPWQLGDVPEYNSFDIIPHLQYDKATKTLVCDSADAALRFLDFHGTCYERYYYSAQKQISDAIVKTLFAAAGFSDVNDQIPVVHNRFTHLVSLWQLNDRELTHYLCNTHPDSKVRSLTRHWLLGGYSSPFVTAIAIKQKGYEISEEKRKIPVFDQLCFKTDSPIVEGIDVQETGAWYASWADPQHQMAYQAAFEKRWNLPPLSVIVAAVPINTKFTQQKGLVDEGLRGNPQEFFSIEGGRYKHTFEERGRRMSGVRIAVHPEMLDLARDAHKRVPASAIMRETYQDIQNK